MTIEKTLKLLPPNIQVKSNGDDETWTWTVWCEEIQDDPNAEQVNWTITLPTLTTADVQCLADQFFGAAGCHHDQTPPDMRIEGE